ncbi:MAG: DUF86 domain-containing protein [Methanolinea sp.]|jgi:uncharacterized protein with HEPN domain|nr:DUF86 domain-containing protein [Methanolinea sp.]
MSEKREPGLFLYDMVTAVDKILDYTHSLALQDLLKNELVKDAVLRNIQVLGDGAKEIPPELKASHPEIDWKGITGLRDIITHQYFRVDWDIIWITIKEDLPSLSISLHHLLESI